MENNRYSAVFMGASVMDLITYTERFPKPGETLSGKEFRKGTGGKAANACVMSARLGLAAAMVAKIGDDIFGHEMLDNFRKHNINIDNIILTKDVFTSTASICVTDDGQNSIVYVPGPANLLSPQEITRVENNIFKGIKLFVTTFECTAQTLHMALKLAKKQGVKTLVNAAPPMVNASMISEIYPLCDCLCLNESEAFIMTGIDINNIQDGKMASQKLLQRGCHSVIITLGENGAVYTDRDTFMHIPIEEKVIPIDTTGAGDAFVGALAYYMVCHPLLSIEEMLKRSCKIASFSVLKQGTQSSYSWKHELPPHLFL